MKNSKKLTDTWDLNAVLLPLSTIDEEMDKSAGDFTVIFLALSMFHVS